MKIEDEVRDIGIQLEAEGKANGTEHRTVKRIWWRLCQRGRKVKTDTIRRIVEELKAEGHWPGYEIETEAEVA